jgi:hypothetical protein
VPLVKAVQELSKSNDDLNLKMSQFVPLISGMKIENAEQGKKINDLQKQIDELRGMMSTNHASAGGNLSTVNSQQSSSLSQNVPNLSITQQSLITVYRKLIHRQKLLSLTKQEKS